MRPKRQHLDEAGQAAVAAALSSSEVSLASSIPMPAHVAAVAWYDGPAGMRVYRRTGPAM
jgi:hypothetical protein